MISYAEALQRVALTVQPLPEVELPLLEALGHILTQAVGARWDMPLLDNSAMDGFAFAYAGQGAGAELAVAGLQRAGGDLVPQVAADSCAKIMTGAPLPTGCDTVVPLEDVEILPAGIRLRLFDAFGGTCPPTRRGVPPG